MVGIPGMWKLLYSPWQTLGVPFALTPIGHHSWGYQDQPDYESCWPKKSGFIRTNFLHTNQEKWWGSGSTRTVDAGPKCAQSSNQIQTLKDCLCYHIYSVQLGPPWATSVRACCAVSEKGVPVPFHLGSPGALWKFSVGNLETKTTGRVTSSGGARHPPVPHSGGLVVSPQWVTMCHRKVKDTTKNLLNTFVSMHPCAYVGVHTIHKYTHKCVHHHCCFRSLDVIWSDTSVHLQKNGQLKLLTQCHFVWKQLPTNVDFVSVVPT